MILLILLFSPLALLIACAIYIDDGAPILFWQTRVGKDGRYFRLSKFRSMHVQKDGSGEGTLEGMTLIEARAKYKTTQIGDSRITRVGSFLRKTHLDEIPQFMNVLVGHMSLVGPRPDVPAQEADYKPKYWKGRVSVLPGVTGIAQVNSGGFTARRRLAADLWYTRNFSFWVDVRVMMITVVAMLKARSI